ncbi:MAG TPA: Kdo domain containing protein [Flavobacteriaceae bacterium]|nr:Kdo domain containing protein [Flavobacteriaceae bacterium]
MKTVFSEETASLREDITKCIETFEHDGNTISKARNTIKIFEFPDLRMNIKAFQKPNFINKIAYRFFRKSKAQRSFEHAEYLLKKGICTPKPIAYLQEDSGIFFGKSYYVSEHLEYDLTYRDIIHDQTFPNRHEILRQFTRFTHKLHENGIEFLDHSPGNTLIVINGNQYEFCLVDLNRMKFHENMDYNTRIGNFKKLTSDKNMVATMSGEYAKITGNDYHKIFSDMWGNTTKFQQHFHQRRKWKKMLKFWK